MEERKDICEGYERDSVQQLDKLAKDKNERFPIYPLTYIQAVYDARTKERLDSIALDGIGGGYPRTVTFLDEKEGYHNHLQEP